MCEPLVSHTLHFLFRSDFQHRTVKRASVSTRHRGKQESGLLVRAPPPLFLLPSATLEPKKGLRGGGDGAVTWLVHTNFDKAGGLGRGGRQAGRRVVWSGSRQACWSPSAGQHRHLQDRCPPTRPKEARERRVGALPVRKWRGRLWCPLSSFLKVSTTLQA